VTVYRTSQTIGVSRQPLGGVDTATLYSISRADRRLTAEEAGSIAALIVDLTAPAASAPELVRGGHDVFHLIVHHAAPSVGD